MSIWMLSPGLFWPPLPFATTMNMSKFGFQLGKSQLEPETDAQSEPVAWNVPERYSVAWPSYELSALFEILALPSM